MLKCHLLEEVGGEVLFAGGRWCTRGTLKSRGQWIFGVVKALPGEDILGIAELITFAWWKERLFGCWETLSMYKRTSDFDSIWRDSISVHYWESLVMFCLERLYLCTGLWEAESYLQKKKKNMRVWSLYNARAWADQFFFFEDVCWSTFYIVGRPCTMYACVCCSVFFIMGCTRLLSCGMIEHNQ